MAKKILLLHDGAVAPAGLPELAGQLRGLGADVSVRPCAEPYDAVLDAVAQAESVVFWG